MTLNEDIYATIQNYLKIIDRKNVITKFRHKISKSIHTIWCDILSFGILPKQQNTNNKRIRTKSNDTEN